MDTTTDLYQRARYASVHVLAKSYASETGALALVACSRGRSMLANEQRVMAKPPDSAQYKTGMHALGIVVYLLCLELGTNCKICMCTTWKLE